MEHTFDDDRPALDPVAVTGYSLPSLENVHLGHFDLQLSRPLTHWEEKALPGEMTHHAGIIRVTAGVAAPDELAAYLAGLGERADRLYRRAREKEAELQGEAQALLDGYAERTARPTVW